MNFWTGHTRRFWFEFIMVSFIFALLSNWFIPIEIQRQYKNGIAMMLVSGTFVGFGLSMLAINEFEKIDNLKKLKNEDRNLVES